ncbi:MAG: hypothetical protein EOP00_00010 [Pedobacter sp.]|nr:MAG: hypothetical protein EOP00_00010 [Pedobacter sp.]
MRRLIKLLIPVFIAFGCNLNAKTENNEQLKTDTVTTYAVVSNTTSIATDTATKSIEEPDENEIDVNYYELIDFEKFAVAEEKNFTKAPLDWEDYPEAKDFKTRITEAYKRDEIDFGGHYILATFGCGASCVMGFMIDVRDGKIYDLPLGEENSCLFAEDRLLGKSTSRLFIAGVCKQNIEDKSVYYKAYLWDEDKKEFKTISKEEFLIK